MQLNGPVYKESASNEYVLTNINNNTALMGPLYYTQAVSLQEPILKDVLWISKNEK